MESHAQLPVPLSVFRFRHRDRVRERVRDEGPPQHVRTRRGAAVPLSDADAVRALVVAGQREAHQAIVAVQIRLRPVFGELERDDLLWRLGLEQGRRERIECILPVIPAAVVGAGKPLKSQHIRRYSGVGHCNSRQQCFAARLYIVTNTQQARIQRLTCGQRSIENSNVWQQNGRYNAHLSRGSGGHNRDRSDLECMRIRVCVQVFVSPSACACA